MPQKIPVSSLRGCIAGYDGHRDWLYALAVSEAARRKGIGTRLVKTAIGCIKVNIQIRATNTRVAAFYCALGFSVEDRLMMGSLPDSPAPSSPHFVEAD